MTHTEVGSSPDAAVEDRVSGDARRRALGPKRVLVVFGSLNRAGAQLRTLAICRELRRRHSIAFDFCILGLGPNELQAETQGVADSIHNVSLRSLRFPLEFSQLLREGQYDVVNSIPKLLSGVILWLAAKQGVPVRIASFRNSLGEADATTGSFRQGGVMEHPAFIRVMRTLIKRNATHVTAVSRGALDTMFPPEWQSGCDCRVVYSGLALAPFQGTVDAGGVRDEFGWPADSRIVVNVGRLSAQKNHRVLLEAAARAYERDQSLRLLLVGRGGLHDEIDRLIDALGLRGMCVITSGRKDIPRLLLASNVFFLPSLWEGLPGAALEAISAGLPVVGSDIAPLREIMPFFPGLILTAPAGDVVQHAEHIRLALEMRPDRDLVQSQFAASPFALENSVDAYRSLYGLD